ncbi:MAG: TIGR01459 family HAD-type hydrolase [Pseudomonadota bacterium]
MAEVDLIHSLEEIIDEADCFIFDQFGVLIDGTRAYAGAEKCLRMLHDRGKSLALLSNSGRRSSANIDRLERFGLPMNLFQALVTSGEALWLDCRDKRLDPTPERVLFLTMEPEDAVRWSAGLDVVSTSDPMDAEAIFLLGVRDGLADDHFDPLFETAIGRGLTLYCANPDLQSPRPGGNVLSPGHFAVRYEQLGGKVVQYGKPYRPIFEQVARLTDAPPNRMVMIGDSIHHDIAGAAGFGIKSVFVRSGLDRARFSDAATDNDVRTEIATLCAAHGLDGGPNWSLHELG